MIALWYVASFRLCIKKIVVSSNAKGQISVASTVTKHIPVYNLVISQSDISIGRDSWNSFEISAPFSRWFDAEGCFIALPFQQWLASEVPVIGDSDPRFFAENCKEPPETVQIFQDSEGLSWMERKNKTTQMDKTSEKIQSRKEKKSNK